MALSERFPVQEEFEYNVVIVEMRVRKDEVDR